MEEGRGEGGRGRRGNKGVGEGEEWGKGEGRELGVQQSTRETWDQWVLSELQHTNGNKLAEVRATRRI